MYRECCARCVYICLMTQNSNIMLSKSNMYPIDMTFVYMANSKSLTQTVQLHQSLAFSGATAVTPC